jgi:hypothetical protein
LRREFDSRRSRLGKRSRQRSFDPEPHAAKDEAAKRPKQSPRMRQQIEGSSSVVLFLFRQPIASIQGVHGKFCDNHALPSALSAWTN